MTKMMICRAAVLAGALSVPMASTTSAQPPVVIGGGGLVNVQIGTINVETDDILSENTVQVSVNAAVQLAANVCGIAVDVLAITGGQTVDCDNADQAVGNVARFLVINP